MVTFVLIDPDPGKQNFVILKTRFPGDPRINLKHILTISNANIFTVFHRIAGYVSVTGDLAKTTDPDPR